MTPENTPKDLTQIRRSDRAVEDENWIAAMLSSAAAGTLATAIDQQPFLNTNLFVYDQLRRCLYMHTARKGRTHTNIDENPRVCFTVFEMGRLLPAPVALEFSVEYASVVVFGTIRRIEDHTEATMALQMLLDKYFPHLQPASDYRPPVSEELKRTAVYRLDIEDWSGKQKQVEPDFPGAFHYPYSTP